MTNMTILREGSQRQPMRNGDSSAQGWALALSLIAVGMFLHASAMDRVLMFWAHRQAWLPDQFWLFMTQWGDSAQALLLLMVLFMKLPVQLAVSLKAWLLGAIAAPSIKAVVDGARPLSVIDPQGLMVIGQPPMIGHSMPSGHAMAAGAVATVLLLGLNSSRPRLRMWVLLACAMVAMSRVAVGAHWPGDVLVGAGLGGLLVILAQAWERSQPWAGHLASSRWQWLLLLLMALLLWTLWQLRSEGWGMSAARVMVTVICGTCVLRLVLERTRKAPSKESKDA